MTDEERHRAVQLLAELLEEHLREDASSLKDGAKASVDWSDQSDGDR
jgi:hypothetical protein